MYRILFVLSMHDSSYVLREVRQSLQSDYPDQFQIDLLNTNDLDKDLKSFKRAVSLAAESDFVFICCHGGFTRFKRFREFFDSFKEKKKSYLESGINDEINELKKYFRLSMDDYFAIYRYFTMGDYDNIYNLILWMAANFGSLEYEYQEPKVIKWEGVYDPEREIIDDRRYIAEVRNRQKPTIGILFHVNNIIRNNLEHIDALIQKIKSLGAVPLAIYTGVTREEKLEKHGIRWLIDNYLLTDGHSNIDVLVNTIGFSLSVFGDPGDGSQIIDDSIFESLGVPVLQALSTYLTLEQWKESVSGLDVMSLVSNIYYPEFDGQIITVPIAYTEYLQDEIGQRNVYRPIADRIDKICRLALNWTRLRRLSNSEKRIAIILHNVPPRNDSIGCAFGLDTPESVFQMINALKADGVRVDYDFSDGQEIIQKIIQGVSNDLNWQSPEQMLEKSVDIVTGDHYREWFSKLSETVQQQVIKDWGHPPGDFMVHQDQLPIPGILNGNIFIGLQPHRAFTEKAEECYHSTDLVCPHQYIAFYKWIKEGFAADVIIHVGTHGTLEWLPGKEKGLSADCYPDIAIDDLPHLYPYIINVTGEGIQAKRRSAAVLLEHMIPSLVESETYDELAQIDDLLKEYYHSLPADSRKIPELQEQIWTLVESIDLHTDIQISKTAAFDDFMEFIDRLHTWTSRIKSSLIKDGLHIFGQIYPEERYKNLLRALVRIDNRQTPSLLKCIAQAKGLDYEELQSRPTALVTPGQTGLMVIDQLIMIGKDLIDRLAEADYRSEQIEQIIYDVLGTQTFDITHLIQCLKFVADELTWRLNRTTDELHYLVEGINGRFVSPGPSGAPTRGRPNILPTGRNFYAIDPGAVPTKSSWEVGKRLADDLLARYLQDEGTYPESVAIVVYSGETMKTYGDDIAEILYLMGVRPVWLESTDRVMGLEVIPLTELKRSRIDVTLRISGLFRDTFPNVIGLVDDAVNLIAALDEAYEDNFIRKHIHQEVQELINRGINSEEAVAEASLRVFGCPPGTYGAGVDILINSRKWQDVDDLGKIYTTWGGHAYSRQLHGAKKQELFALRLAKTQVTVKNESSVEIDMFDSDDFYNYHGGLIAAVRTHSGQKPRSYSANTANPERTELLDLHEETSRIMRARINNPRWIAGLKEHGYKGAQEFASMVDIVFGWDATSAVVDDWMYEKIAENYIFNEENRKWIEEVNQWALHSMIDRLLESIQRGMWKASTESKDQLTRLYLEIEGSIEDSL